MEARESGRRGAELRRGKLGWAFIQALESAVVGVQVCVLGLADGVVEQVACSSKGTLLLCLKEVLRRSPDERLVLLWLLHALSLTSQRALDKVKVGSRLLLAGGPQWVHGTLAQSRQVKLLRVAGEVVLVEHGIHVLGDLVEHKLFWHAYLRLRAHSPRMLRVEA